ncbi:replication factor C subunit 1-like [Teleopsis dalmanni]|uniref:replication factor C subunit 1-like n=1 Tax=Teleopsis dalmanni TaxID=139649 RepID=UPI0018CD468B|nr:replication factor C subunit 1-like [Teleopsis dalmanni]
MQRSIDSFFKRTTQATKKKEDEKSTPVSKKRKLVVVSSDEDEVLESPQVSKSKEHKKQHKEDKTSSPEKKASLWKLKSSPQKNLKRVDPSVLFGGETKRIEAKKPGKPKEQAVIDLDDDEINQSLMDTDVDELLLEATNRHVERAKNRDEEVDEQETPVKNTTPTTPKTKFKLHISDLENDSSSVRKKAKLLQEEDHDNKSRIEKITSDGNKKDKKRSPTNEQERTISQKHEQLKTDDVTDGVNKNKYIQKDKEECVVSSAKKAKLNQENQTEHKKTPKSDKKERSTPKTKNNSSDLETSVLTDEERHERKRMTAILYQKYKNRSSCLNHGSKEVPKGKPNCLAGLTFLITGVLESLERDEAASIIKEYGGKVMSTVGKRLQYLIVGEEAGPKKLAQAEEFGITILSEDGLFDLIRNKSGDKSHTAIEEKPTSLKNKDKSDDKIKLKKEDSITPQKKYKEEKKTPQKLNKTPTFEKMKDIKAESNNNHNNNNNLDKTYKIKSEEKLEQKPAVKKEVDEDVLAWVDKYKPKTVKEIIGQQGAASNVNKLTNWLSKWYINHDGKKKLQKPNPWTKNDDGSYYKAALLSGPPGIGKTTTATLVCKELGFDTVEFNASDTRNKRLLKEQVAELLTNKSLYGFCHGSSQAVSKKHVLIMDEVDGMAGNEDRGGIQELIGLIKESSVPIICMCNDRNHQKMRSLVNYCYDLRFNRPNITQIKGAIMTICFKEKLKMDPKKVEEIIAATNNDIRQTINHISLLSAGKKLNLESSGNKTDDKVAQKDLKLGPWEVARKVFSAEEHKHMSLYDKCDLFFHDYSLGPLFVQQNYLQVIPAGPKKDIINKVALTADALSLGDLVEKRIRSNNAWSLLPTQAVFSSVMPGEYMSGIFTSQINFPGWLGKYSRANKRKRLAQEIHDHTRIRTSASRQSIRLDYAPHLLANIVRPLKEHGAEGVENSLDVLKEYHLLREDIESLIELTTWPGKKSLMDAVDGRVKAALTRSYNKEVLAYTYSASVGIKKKKAETTDDDDIYGVDGEGDAVVESDDEKDDNVENDALIKMKKKTTTTTSAGKASSSKATKKTGTTAPKAKASSSKIKK